MSCHPHKAWRAHIAADWQSEHTDSHIYCHESYPTSLGPQTMLQGPTDLNLNFEPLEDPLGERLRASLPSTLLLQTCAGQASTDDNRPCCGRLLGCAKQAWRAELSMVQDVRLEHMQGPKLLLTGLQVGGAAIDTPF